MYYASEVECKFAAKHRITGDNSLKQKEMKLEELVPVYELGDSIILLVPETELAKPRRLCVQVNLGMHKFDEIMEVGRYLTFNPFEPIDYKNKLLRESYYLLINRKFTDKMVEEMLVRFTDILERKKVIEE